ncbi:hypothetical protein ACN42_g8370 [Penicillium freii]|uniref:Uncharacterized protein n=1 Tax=Penicillium freii TaxID=48697 RepID=A0A101MDW7_PENFR|nr:hypothetical protein ACN42_g8370 [Penicillium freii]
MSCSPQARISTSQGIEDKRKDIQKKRERGANRKVHPTYNNFFPSLLEMIKSREREGNTINPEKKMKMVESSKEDPE